MADGCMTWHGLEGTLTDGGALVSPDPHSGQDTRTELLCEPESHLIAGFCQIHQAALAPPVFEQSRLPCAICSHDALRHTLRKALF